MVSCYYIKSKSFDTAPGTKDEWLIKSFLYAPEGIFTGIPRCPVPGPNPRPNGTRLGKLVLSPVEML